MGRGVPLLSVDKVREQDWVPEMSSLVIVMLIKKLQNTVGADKNETLVFVHFSAQGASISVISVAIR